MNFFGFEGRLSDTPTLQTKGDRQFCRFTLIRNEFAGEDKEERVVAPHFVIFGKRAEYFSKNCRKGDQVIVSSRLQTDRYEKGDKTEYSSSFIVDDFSHGAPGAATRAVIAERMTQKNQGQGGGHADDYLDANAQAQYAHSGSR